MKISNLITHDNGDHSFFLDDNTVYAAAEYKKSSTPTGVSLYLISGNIHFDNSSHLIFLDDGVYELRSTGEKCYLDGAVSYVCKYYNFNKKSKNRSKARKATRYFIKREFELKDRLCERERRAVIESEMVLAYMKNKEPVPVCDLFDGLHFGNNLSCITLNGFVVSNETTKEEVLAFLKTQPQISYSEEAYRITCDGFKLENANVAVSSINFCEEVTFRVSPRVSLIFFSPIFDSDNALANRCQSVESFEQFVSLSYNGPQLKAKSSLSFLAEWKSVKTETPNNSNALFCGWHTRNGEKSPNFVILFLFGREFDYRFYAPFHMGFAHDFLKAGDFAKAFEYNYYYYQQEPENLFFIVNCLLHCIRLDSKQTQEWYDLSMGLLRDGNDVAVTDINQTYHIMPWAIDERVISTCLQSKKHLDFAAKLTNNLIDFACHAGILDKSGKVFRNEEFLSSWQIGNLIKKLYAFTQALKKLGYNITPPDKKAQDFHTTESNAAQQDWRSNLYIINERCDLVDVYFNKWVSGDDDDFQLDDGLGNVLVVYDTIAAALSDNSESYPIPITISEISDLLKEDYDAVILQTSSGRRLINKEEVQ